VGKKLIAAFPSRDPSEKGECVTKEASNTNTKYKDSLARIRYFGAKFIFCVF
jgi:hypothetical protein